MAETEAAALLRNGALYARRIGLRDEAGRLLFAGLKRGAFSLYFDDEPIYHFDLDGRWQRAYIDGNHVRKALDQSVDGIGRSRVPEGIALRRRRLSPGEVATLDDSIRDVAIDLCVGLASGRFEVENPPDPGAAMPPDELRDLLDRVSAWDAAAWFSMKERHVGIYGHPPSFIPPDAQNAIVLRPFDRDGEPRNRQAFAAHCRDVARLLGRRAIQASTAFLVDDRTLRRPVEETLANLDAIAEVFPVRDDPRPARPRDLPPDRPSLSGVDVSFEFWKGSDDLPDAGGWRALSARRVRRVTVSFLEPGASRDSLPSVVHARAAGIAVSVVMPYGSVEPERAVASVDAVLAMPLGRGDFVHLVNDLEEEAPREREALEALLAGVRAKGVKINDYNPAKQWT